MWRSDPLASAAGPAASIAMKGVGSAVRSIEAMDANEFMKNTIKQIIPNAPFKGPVVDLANEAFGVR
jgi:hypothetical protein